MRIRLNHTVRSCRKVPLNALPVWSRCGLEHVASLGDVAPGWNPNPDGADGRV